MRVRVEIMCAPCPEKEILSALRSMGEELALRAASVSAHIDPANPRIAILTFDMRRSAQYKAVDEIYPAVKLWAGDFYQDVTIHFPKD